MNTLSDLELLKIEEELEKLYKTAEEDRKEYFRLVSLKEKLDSEIKIVSEDNFFKLAETSESVVIDGYTIDMCLEKIKYFKNKYIKPESDLASYGENEKQYNLFIKAEKLASFFVGHTDSLK